MHFIQLFVILVTLIQLRPLITDAFILNKTLSISQLKNIQPKLLLKINSDSDGKIKYATDLYHLTNYDLTNIYTIIGSKSDIKTNNLVKRLGQINKKFVFIDKSLYEQNNMNQLMSYYNYKQKINLTSIKQPWIFYEYKYIVNDEVFKHLL